MYSPQFRLTFRAVDMPAARQAASQSARALAVAAVVGGGMLGVTRSSLAGEGGPRPPTEFVQPAGEGALPTDGNWPGKPARPAGEQPGTVPAAGPREPVAAASDAGPPRPSLLPLAQPLWTELTPAQQTALAAFADQWNTWPAAEKRSWVALADSLPKMDAAKRQKAFQRIAEWAGMSAEERRTARANYRLAKERSPDTRVSEWERYRSMTQEQRTVLRQAGSTSNTAAGHAGAPTGLAKEAAQPLPREPRPPGAFSVVPAVSAPPR